MSSKDLLLMSLGNLWRRRLRTLLTILGVVIGCASIIVMLSLGYGMKATNEKALENIGSVDVIRVVPYPSYNAETKKETKAAPLNEKALKTIKAIPHVISTLPIIQVKGSTNIVCKKYETYGDILGVDPATMKDFGFKLEWGRLLEEGDSNAAIFGAQTAQGWYNPKGKRRFNDGKSPVDIQKDKIQISLGGSYDENGKREGGKSFKITPVGQFVENDWERAYSLIISTTFAEKLNSEAKKLNSKGSSFSRFKDETSNSKYTSILIKVDDIKNMHEVNDQLKALKFNTQSNLDITDALNKQVASQQKILGGIGAVSLLVAAIGIANTMIMSIYERIKEIGVMKVIGASVSDIKKMFLTEAALIGLFGGALGVGLSYLISALLNKFSNSGSGGILGNGLMFGDEMEGAASNISIIPPWLIIAALFFSALIGVLSGYYPANKATKLSPLEAIKTQ